MNKFSDFFRDLEGLPWNKEIINNGLIEENKEVAEILKGVGVYDSIPNRYIPLPCTDGIALNKLYGRWRTYGDYRGDANNYNIITIDKTGNWYFDRFNSGEISRKVSAKIKSINNQQIIVGKKDWSDTLEIIHLGENCFTYKAKYDGRYKKKFDGRPEEYKLNRLK